MPRSPEVSAWKVEEVCGWATAAGLLAVGVAALRREHVDGKALLDLTDEEAKNELRLPLGQRKLLFRVRAEALAAAVGEPSPRESREDNDALRQDLLRQHDALRRRVTRAAVVLGVAVLLGVMGVFVLPLVPPPNGVPSGLLT
jgi:hypothetical protein